jgi:hypothetical protein
MKYVLLYHNSKIPVGENWPERAFDESELSDRLARNPRAGVGLLLGPKSGVIDVECDSEEATAVFGQLFPDVRTPNYVAKRGGHFLFRWDDRLKNLTGAPKYKGLEFRLGTGDAHQSVAPPSIVDGVKREWVLSPKDCEFAPLPESVIQILLTLPPAPKRCKSSVEIPASRKAKVERLTRYCKRVGIELGGSWESNSLLFLEIQHCPFKGPESLRGAPVIIVFPDGGHTFKCFHPDCADKRWADIEAVYGPLYPRVALDHDLGRAVHESIGALKEDPDVLQRGVLVQVVHDAPRPKQCLHDHGSPQIRPISKATLRAKLTNCARFERWDKRAKKHVRCLPSDHVVEGVLSSPEFDGIPVVTGVVSCPILRPDGEIAAKRGYDPETGVYLDVNGSYPDLMKPQEAVKLLCDVICDFPFLSERDRASFIAQVVTLLSRYAFGGVVPFCLTDANRSGAGKGLLGDVTTMIYEGRPATRYSAPKNSEELRKVITTVVLSGVSYYLIDNIKGKFGGDEIEKALTAARWSDRLLGLNRKIDLPVHHVTLGTGNNCQLTGDMVRRTLYCRLESPEEDPSRRTGFSHNPLLDYVRTNRPALIMAALSIPAQFIQAKRPDQGLPPWGGFEQWSDLIRNSLVWAGLPDPDTRETLAAQVDDDSVLLRQVMEAWKQLGGPSTIRDAIVKAECGEAPALLAALEDLPGRDRNRALGNLLRHNRGRVMDQQKFERTDSKRPKWEVISIAEGGSPATAGADTRPGSLSKLSPALVRELSKLNAAQVRELSRQRALMLKEHSETATT